MITHSGFWNAKLLLSSGVSPCSVHRLGTLIPDSAAISAMSQTNRVKPQPSLSSLHCRL